MTYEQAKLKEAIKWSRSLEKRSSLLQRSSKRVQSQINEKIPDKFHAVVTESIKRMIELSLTSSEYIRKVEVKEDWSFSFREERVLEKMKEYKTIASFEGAGTGAGGILLGLADFPLLLSIKMKFLFDVGQLYGMDVTRYEERVYLLHLFLLAFSSDEPRTKVRDKVVNWEELDESERNMDWKTLQLEYRDTIDFVKMLQLVPGIGAFVGFVVNRRLIGQLGEAAMNGYRLRLLR